MLRPDGVEIDRRQITGDRLGAYQLAYELARDARIGAWRVEFRLDPKAPPVGTIEFRVEDFVPPQLKLGLSAGDGPIVPGDAFPIGVEARYYYGAPGADLPVEAEATIAFDEAPFPSEPGFRFGLESEEFAGTRQDVEAAPTDSDGKSAASLTLTDPPDLTKPLAATVRLSVVEPSGRTVTETVTRPIRQRPLAIGLRSPNGDEAVPEGQAASVEIIAVDPDGRRLAKNGLRWELLRETWQYDWYSVNGVWRHRTQVRNVPIEAGTLDIAANAPGSLSRTLPAGRYRWEVIDGDSGAQSSLRFHVGWWVEAEMPDVPDKLEAASDKTSYQPGDVARLFVKAPFAGEAEISIASDRILAMRSIALPADGATVEIPVESGWGSGVYALVSAYRPSALGGPRPRGPGRAVGVAWLGTDPAPRTLSVTLTVPAVARPRGSVDIAVKVDGAAAGEESFVTIAAVDEAVLKLTEFDSPAPEMYFYGKRRLGVELRDIYGRLIDPRADGVGVLRSGGDQFAKRSVSGLPDKSSRVVALFSGPVRVGVDGTANVHFDVPDFQGELRVMAVAYGAHELGSGNGAIVIRDPVVTLVSLPRFMAPGDAARLRVVVNNIEGEPGDYRLTMSATGAGGFTMPIDRSITIGSGQSFSDAFTLSANTTGNIGLNLELTGPGGLRIARAFTVGVRPAQSYQLRRFVGRLEPGQSVTLDDNAADAFLPGTAEAFLTVSPRPDWDVPGLLRALDRYAYGCLEQTTSRALPLLYFDAVAGAWRTDPGFSAAEAVDRAIGHVVELQRADGSFGVWNDTDNTVPWLDAYATDFLIRAKEHGRNVPDFAIKAALGWLRDFVRQDHTRAEELPAVAYAHYVLARGRAGDVPTLRYFNDTQLAKLPTQLAMAQLGAALAQAGDVTRANAAYAAALGAPPRRPAGLRFVDYGSELRDSAAVLALSAGNPGKTPRLTEVMDRVVELFARANRTSTQEQAWLLMAAEAAARESGGSMTTATGDAAPQTGDKPVYLTPRAWQRRGAGYDRQSRNEAGMADGVDQRRAQGRSAGREQRLYRVPRRVRPRRHAGRSVKGAAKRAVCRGDQRQPRRRRTSRPHAGYRSAPGRIRDRERDPGRGQVAAGLRVAQRYDGDGLYRGARRPLRQRARPSRRRQGFHAGLCGARGHCRAILPTRRLWLRTCTIRRPPAAPRWAGWRFRRSELALLPIGRRCRGDHGGGDGRHLGDAAAAAAGARPRPRPDGAGPGARRLDPAGVPEHRRQMAPAGRRRSRRSALPADARRGRG